MHKTRQLDETSHETMGFERIVFFSDAVMAIAITLLVLEIRVPEMDLAGTNSELARQVFALWPKYLGYVTSFLVIGLFWTAHHRVYNLIQHYDSRLIWLNMLFLLGVAFVPFPTALLYSYTSQFIAVLFYACTMIFCGLMITWLWLYALRKGLTRGNMDRRTIRLHTVRLLVAPIVFALSILLAVFQADLAMYSWILLVPLLILVARAQRNISG